MRTLLVTAMLVLAFAPSSRTEAQAAEAYAGSYNPPTSRDIVVAYNVGWRFSIAPGVFIPVDDGNIGFSIAGDVRYGFDLGPLVLAPGVRLAGYFPSDLTVLAGLGTLRATFPVGMFGPFVQGGVGPGWVSEPSKAGLAWLAGGGFMVHFGTRFGFGAEASYQAITGTDFNALFIGPSFLIGL
jgi:hypothetical protein